MRRLLVSSLFLGRTLDDIRTLPYSNKTTDGASSRAWITSQVQQSSRSKTEFSVLEVTNVELPPDVDPETVQDVKLLKRKSNHPPDSRNDPEKSTLSFSRKDQTRFNPNRHDFQELDDLQNFKAADQPWFHSSDSQSQKPPTASQPYKRSSVERAIWQNINWL